MMIKIFTKILAIVMLISLASPVIAQTYTMPYQKLLQLHIKKGAHNNINAALVDYDRWAKNPLHKKALEALLSTDPSRLTATRKMAFWINAYNLLTIDLIIKNAERKSIKNLGSWWQSPWKKHHWTINNQSITLDQIEHEILRPMGDPRIHMAINCASLSCPDLRREPYDPKKLSQQLDAQTRAFLNDKTKGMVITPDGLVLSPIFKWFAEDFAEDFGREDGIIRFIRKYKSKLPRKTSIDDHLDYDWGLNNY